MSSSLALEVIVSHLRELAELGVPHLSDASDTVALLCRAVKRVKNDKEAFEELGTKAAKLLYVFVDGLREKGQRDLDDNSKINVDAFKGVVEKVLELALKNSMRSDFIAFWSSDGKEINILRSELDARLRAFGFQSFDDLDVETKQSQSVKASEKPKSLHRSGSSLARPQTPVSYNRG